MGADSTGATLYCEIFFRDVHIRCWHIEIMDCGASRGAGGAGQQQSLWQRVSLMQCRDQRAAS
jgi:hypothetical protein